MTQSAGRSCLERMCDVIAASEDRILQMVTDAVRADAVDHAPRSQLAWRESVRGLSDAIFQAVYGHLEITPDGLRRDPVVAYGVVRGRMQHDRGVLASDWSRLLRHYRRAYVELVRGLDFRPEELVVCRRFIDWVFDRLEDGFTQGYPESPPEPRQAAGA